MINKVVIIHYLAHQILTNKNSPSERNHQLRKMKTQPNTAQPKKIEKYYHKNKS